MLAAGKVAPDFTLEGIDGKTHSLAAALKHGPVVLAFFKVSCPVCQFTFPYLQRMAQRFAGKNVTVAGISQDDARDTKEFNLEYGVTFPVLLDDASYTASNAYGL